MIYVSDKAKEKLQQLMQESNKPAEEGYFARVDNGVKVVTDLKSFLYLVNTTLEFSDGLNGKGFFFNNPNASRTCACGESFAV
jgi:Uncharacterized conserved protein